MITRRIDFNYKALQLQLSLTVEGSVPGRQSYNADTAEFIPDYTIVNLVLQPVVSIIDDDEILESGRVNASLADITWVEIINGTSTTISSGTDYVIETTGDNAGQLTVCKNATPEAPITLQFSATYADNRTGQVHTINLSYLLFCGKASDEITISLDAADTTLYNPLTDAAMQTVTATVLRAGKTVVSTGDYNLIWESMDENGAWHVIGEDVLDYEVTVADDGGSVTVDRSLVPGEANYRCRCQYDAEGNPDSVDIDESLPCTYFNFKRRIPAYEANFIAPDVPADCEEVNVEAIVTFCQGTIDGWESELQPVWYVATNTTSGNNLSYTQVAEGKTATIPTTYLDAENGASIGLEIEDRGAYKAWADTSDGAVLTDADGSVLLLH